MNMKVNRKPPGFWTVFSNLERELLAFIMKHGTPGVMPTVKQLRQYGFGCLANAIDKNYGGVRKVAERPGLELTCTRKPVDFWDDFSNMKHELLAFILEHGTPGVMPSRKLLRRHKKGDLINAFQKYGGAEKIANRLGLKLAHSQKQHDYWKDFGNLKRELLSFIKKYGNPSEMPTRELLRQYKRGDLAHAIQEHGGVAKVAEQLGLKIAYRPDDYWDDIANVGNELRAFVAKNGTPGEMPTRTALRKYKQGQLARAIEKHGAANVAGHFGLKLPYRRKRNGYWNDFANVERELLAFIAKHGTPGRMPTGEQLIRAGLHDLASAIRKKHGGLPKVAARLGLELAYTVKPDNYWDDFANVERELLAFISEYGTPGLMPSGQQFRKAGYSSLQFALQKHGGLSAIARKLGLVYTGAEYITARTASEVERIVRALQPLAEAHLLPGPHIMIILRRAGMPNFRNSRIASLGPLLIRGDRDELEDALARLKAGPEELATEVFSPQEEESDDFYEIDVEALVNSDLGINDTPEPALPLSGFPAPDLQRERSAIHGLSALGEIRLPLDEVLSLLTSKILWEAFYKRLYAWYGSLYANQTVAAEDIESAILSAYPQHRDNEFVARASVKFAQEVEEAVNFAAALPSYGWRGPHLRLDQAYAAHRMAEVLKGHIDNSFLLLADEAGIGKSLEFLAAVAASGVRSVLLVAPKFVADDTWADLGSPGEIRRCLNRADIVRGLPQTLERSAAYPPSEPTFFVLHYEELLSSDGALEILKTRTFDCLCVDEMHRIKQRAHQKQRAERKIDIHLRRQAIEAVRGCAHAAVGLTGTPLVNELAEPLSLLQILSQHDPQFDYTRLRNYRMSDIADVFEALVPHVIRRRKQDVLLHLPPYDIRPVEIALPPDIEEQMIDIYMRCKSNVLVKLRKLLTEAKLPYILRRAQEAHKLLILTYLKDEVSRKIASYLEKYLPGRVAHINGDTVETDRRKLIESFRDPNGVPVLVGTIGTIGEGLTLFDPAEQITTSEMIMADLPYTWAEFEQGVGRLHRMGQKQCVRVDVLQTSTVIALCNGSPFPTLDTCVWDLITGKRKLSDLAIDGEYETSNATVKVRKALHHWLKQAREIGFEPLVVERRRAEESDALKWRREIARLRGMKASKAHEAFADPDYTQEFLEHLKVSPASKLSYTWLRERLRNLLRSDLDVVDMGCGLHPLADLPCRIIGLDRQGLPGQLRGKMENPPLPDASADVLVYSLSLYGTAENLLSYFSHARRILRGGGHLFIVEPKSAFAPKSLGRFLKGLREFGFEPADKVKEVRSNDGTILIGMHLTLTGEMGKPDVTAFERK